MEERLKILYDGNVIDSEIYKVCVDIHDNIFVIRGLDKKNAYTTLMTHLAMAAQRIKNKEKIQPMEKMIVNELKQQREFKKAEEILNTLSSYFSFELPEEELDYVLLHLLNMLQEENYD